MHDETPRTQALLQRLRAGERDALALLYDHYRPRLRQMLRLRMDARIAARVDDSDVLQEAYLDAARQLPAYLDQPRVAVYIWLRGLVWDRLFNLQRHHLGTQRRAVQREVPLPAESSALLVQQLLARGPSPSQLALQEEQRQRVQRALAQLDPSDREVILMRHFEGLSNGEVAQAHGLGDSGA